MEFFLHRISFSCKNVCVLDFPLELRNEIRLCGTRFPGLYLHTRIHSCFGCHYCIVFSNTVTLFLSGEEAFVVVALQNSFSVSREDRGERVCILFAMYSITFLRFTFLIWRCARCFHGFFSQINFCHISGEALSLPSAFVCFAVVSLLVPTACKTFCSRKWNSMLVPAAD